MMISPSISNKAHCSSEMLHIIMSDYFIILIVEVRALYYSNHVTFFEALLILRLVIEKNNANLRMKDMLKPCLLKPCCQEVVLFWGVWRFTFNFFEECPFEERLSLYRRFRRVFVERNLATMVRRFIIIPYMLLVSGPIIMQCSTK